MGWVYFKLKDGREAGYAVDATCDHPGCSASINRGMSFVCGDMHEGGKYGCGKYFCVHHLDIAIDAYDAFIEGGAQLCPTCLRKCEEAHGVKFDENGKRLDPDDVEEVPSAGPATEARAD